MGLTAFLIAAALVTIAPGPDTFLVIGHAMRGLGRGLATVAGIVCGGAFYLVLFGFGVARLLAHSPQVFAAVKLLGAAYLVWLGVGALRSALRKREADPAATAADPAASTSWRRAFLQGVLTNALNPKIAVFYLAFLPQFIAPGEDIATRSMQLIAIHYAMGAAWLSLVAVGVHRAGAWLRRPAVSRILDGAIGAAMTAFGLRLALASR